MNLSHVEVLDSKVHFVPMAAINTKFCFVSKGAPLREETEPVPQAPDTGLVVKVTSQRNTHPTVFQQFAFRYTMLVYVILM